ncbi:MAG TPA: site-specific integrase [Gammaproteobacteria bacterium]|nr:site-specific integrase [Gammaproteobacteria bacterium]
MATIRKRGRYWQAQVRRKGYPNLSATFDKKTEAKDWAQQVEADLRAGRAHTPPPHTTTVTLQELLERYLEEITPTHRGARSERHRIATLLRHELVEYSVDLIDPPAIARYRDKRLREVKPATVVRELSLLSHLYTTARREWGYQVGNPVKDVRRPRQPQGRDRRLEPGEEERLLAAADQARSIWIRPLIELAIETGARRSELLALQWQDVDWQKRVATLRDTKNGETRSIPLSSRAVATLRRLPRAMSGSLIPISANAAKLAWERTRRRAGMLDFRFHDLRHEATSRFFENGFSITEVASITGHKDLRMLYRYTHHRAAELAQRLG